MPKMVLNVLRSTPASANAQRPLDRAAPPSTLRSIRESQPGFQLMMEIFVHREQQQARDVAPKKLLKPKGAVPVMMLNNTRVVCFGITIQSARNNHKGTVRLTAVAPAFDKHCCLSFLPFIHQPRGIYFSRLCSCMNEWQVIHDHHQCLMRWQTLSPEISFQEKPNSRTILSTTANLYQKSPNIRRFLNRYKDN